MIAGTHALISSTSSRSEPFLPLLPGGRPDPLRAPPRGIFDYSFD
jgi:hypothetical protein